MIRQVIFLVQVLMARNVLSGEVRMNLMAPIINKPARRPEYNPAEYRKILAQAIHKRRWGAGVIIALLLMTTTSSAGSYVDLEVVKDGHLHRFVYRASGGEMVRYIVILKGGSAYGVGLDACEICGATGYCERDTKIFSVIAASMHDETLAAAMLNVMFDVGDKVNRELKVYGANITVTPKNSAVLKDVYGPETHEYLNESDLGKIKTIFRTNNIVAFVPRLDGTLTLADGSKISAAGTWFNHEMTLPTGDTLKCDGGDEDNQVFVTLAAMQKILNVSPICSISRSAKFGTARLTSARTSWNAVANSACSRQSARRFSVRQSSTMKRYFQSCDGLSRSSATTRQRISSLRREPADNSCGRSGDLRREKISDVREILSGHEIVGAANENIVREFLGEGCLLGAFGGLFGSGLGYLFAESVSLQVFGRGKSDTRAHCHSR